MGFINVEDGIFQWVENLWKGSKRDGVLAAGSHMIPVFKTNSEQILKR